MREYRFVMAGLFVLAALPAGAAGYWPSASRDGVKLNAEDTRMMEAAVDQALEQRKEGAVSTWANNATNIAGQATVTKVYLHGTQPCGTVEHVFTKGAAQKGTARRFELPFCHQPDGSWKIQY